MFDNEMYNIKKHIKINCLTEIKTRSVKNLNKKHIIDLSTITLPSFNIQMLVILAVLVD